MRSLRGAMDLYTSCTSLKLVNSTCKQNPTIIYNCVGKFYVYTSLILIFLLLIVHLFQRLSKYWTLDHVGVSLLAVLPADGPMAGGAEGTFLVHRDNVVVYSS